MAAIPLSTRERALRRKASLWQERATWDSHIGEISRVLLPRSSRFLPTDRNDGRKKHNQIYDNTGTMALRTLAAGMMSGMTSPARPWFRLAVADLELMKRDAVKLWLNEVTVLMLQVFAKSNTYRAFHKLYTELGAFGTGACIVTRDFNSVIHCTPLTFGEYALGVNYKGETDVTYRELQKPVSAVVREFGYENCSSAVKLAYDRGDYDQWVSLVHGIEPRLERDLAKRGAKNKPFRSVYLETAHENPNAILRESGFDTFPVLAPRWDLDGSDIYGSSPGMVALGDVKQLQHEQLRKATAIDYQSLPPRQLPESMRGQEAGLLPGGVTYTKGDGSTGGVRTAFETDLRLDYLLEDIRDVRERIRSAFYADLFLMMASDDGTGRMTATEVAERHEEKLLMLGPVLERLHNEMLSPMIDIVFEVLLTSGLIPPPPEEMQGMALDVEFVSMLAQAQRAVATNSIDRFVGSLGTVAALGKPGVLDRFDEDVWAEEYSDMLGVDPKLIVSGEKVALIRKARAEQAQQAQEAALRNEQVAQVAKLGSVKTQGGQSNAGADIMNLFSGYGSPSAENY